ncbi:MAG: hypothetical protein QNK05_06130 [Myxococcota bacterium]|nr:hypothetical protein [Myxococcota bacterium]
MTRRSLAGLAFAATLLACGGESREAPTAVVTPRAALVIEPPTLALGSTARVEIAVATPPDHRVAPIAPPDRVGGIWILEVLPPQIDQRRERWTHRFEYHIRTRATGRFVWPEVEVPVEDPEGRVEVLRVAARPFEVVPVLSEEMGPHRFLPLQSPGTRASGPPTWLAALGGAGVTLLGFAAAAWLRRKRPSASAATASSLPPSWRQAQRTLAAARELAGEDPRRAADMASAALRLHLERRFGVAALTATTEELRRQSLPRSPGLGEERWDRALSLLESLDGVRFLPPEERTATGPLIERTADACAALVAEDIPRGYAPAPGGGSPAPERS